MQAMKTRAADRELGVRERLLVAAERLLATGGPDALQARKLAAAIGASTMAVYTHFGGMRELVDALVREGFVQLSDRVTPPQSDDPVADLFRLGLSFRNFAVEKPELYRVMFGISRPAGHRPSVDDVTTAGMPTMIEEGQVAFAHLIRAVTRVVDSGRAQGSEPVLMAAQMWSSVHGYVLLELGGYFGDQGSGVDQILIPLWINLAVGVGDTRAAATRSAQAAKLLHRRPRT
jgi:AcrR family transcriptional regulator